MGKLNRNPCAHFARRGFFVLNPRVHATDMTARAFRPLVVCTTYYKPGPPSPPLLRKGVPARNTHPASSRFSYLSAKQLGGTPIQRALDAPAFTKESTMFLQTLARILADKMHLEVIYNPGINTFAIGKDTNGKLTIHLATRILDTAGENVDAILRGALAHEALGHGYYTAMDELAKNGRFALSLANAFEDVRIETLAPERFPGARRLLANMVDVLQKDFGFWQPAPLEDWQSNLVKGLLLKYRNKILGQPVNMDNCSIMIEQSVLPALGEDLFKKIDHLAETACRAATTKEVNDAADAIVELLNHEVPQPEEEPQSSKDEDPDPKKDDSDEEGDENDQGKADNGEEGDPGQEDPSDGQPSQDDCEGDAGTDPNTGGSEADPQPGKPNPGGKPGGKQQRLAFDPNAEVKADVETALEEVSGSKDTLKATGLSVSSFSDHTDRKSDAPLVESNGSLARMIAAQLENAVRSFTDDAEDEESEVGRLNTEKFVEIATGTECKAFIEDGTPGEGIDTELMFLFDASTSMEELGVKKLQQLLKASLTALSQFAPDLGTSVAFFTGSASLEAKPGPKLTPNQINAIAYNYYPDGVTYWAESVVPLIPVLAGSYRRRKILLTVTDGKLPPLGDTPLMRELRRQGIECRFLSIGEALPAGYEGMQCEAEPAAFAKAFCETILAGILPQFA